MHALAFLRVFSEKLLKDHVERQQIPWEAYKMAFAVRLLPYTQPQNLFTASI